MEGLGWVEMGLSGELGPEEGRGEGRGDYEKGELKFEKRWEVGSSRSSRHCCS
jgi:hypothetical protein